jgi:phage FluMu gp28-like protein
MKSRDVLRREDFSRVGTFLDYQRRWIMDPGPMAIVEKGRQEGFTYCEAFWSVFRRLMLAERGKRLNHYFSSADAATAKEFVDKCCDWARVLNMVAEHDAVGIDDGISIERLRTRGGDIIAVSSKAKALRGKKGDVTLDEFAFAEDADSLIDAAEACTTWGTGDEPGHLRIISTHNGPGTLFRRMANAAKSGDNGFNHHFVSIHEAVRDGIAVLIPGPHQRHLDGTREGRQKCDAEYIASKRRRSRSAAAFSQEYECQPISSGSVILPIEYDSCVRESMPVTEDLDPASDYNGHELFAGIDVGHTHDLTVVWVVERGWVPHEKNPALDDLHRTVYRTVAVKAIHNEPIPAQWQMIRGMIGHRCMSKVLIDPGTVGAVLCNLAVQQFGDIVEPYSITRGRKAELCERLRQFVQERRVSLPRNERIREDVLSMRRETTDGGQARYDGSTRFSHCDYFVALSLALQAAEGGRESGIMVMEDSEAA